MLRRKPTRIELKLDDLEEYEALKREKELEKKSSQSTGDLAMTPEAKTSGKSIQEMIHMRIGYDLQSLPKPSRKPIH